MEERKKERKKEESNVKESIKEQSKITEDVNSLPFKANSDWISKKEGNKQSFEELIAPQLNKSYKKQKPHFLTLSSI